MSRESGERFGENKKRRAALCWADHLDLMGNLDSLGVTVVPRRATGRRPAGSMITINYDLSALSPRRTVTHKAIPAIGERATPWNNIYFCIKCIDSFDLLTESR